MIFVVSAALQTWDEARASFPKARPAFVDGLYHAEPEALLQAIEGTGTDARMGRLAQQIYAAFAEGDGAGRDFSGIITDIRAGEV